MANGMDAAGGTTCSANGADADREDGLGRRADRSARGRARGRVRTECRGDRPWAGRRAAPSAVSPTLIMRVCRLAAIRPHRGGIGATSESGARRAHRSGRVHRRGRFPGSDDGLRATRRKRQSARSPAEFRRRIPHGRRSAVMTPSRTAESGDPLGRFRPWRRVAGSPGTPFHRETRDSVSATVIPSHSHRGAPAARQRRRRIPAMPRLRARRPRPFNPVRDQVRTDARQEETQ